MASPGNPINPTGSTGWNYSNWGGNSWYNPNSSYGSSQYKPGEFQNTLIGNEMLESPDGWDASWTRYLSELGLAPNTNAGRWAATQFGQAKTGYEAALATNPLLKFNEYIRGLDVPGMYNQLTAQQRGENPGMFAPRARTISRGF